MFNRLNPEARIAVMQATDVARQLGHTEVGPDHVLLGLLANVRGETYALLNSHGLEFDSAKTIVIDRHPVTEAAHLNRQNPARTPDQAAAELDEDRAALRAIGIDLDKVREAVRSAFGDDITAEWGERSRRGRGRGGPEGRGGRRGRGGPRGHHHHHHDHVDGAERDTESESDEGREGGAPDDRRGRGGRGRRGPRSERFGDRAPFSESLRDTLRDTVREARLGTPTKTVVVLAEGG